MLKLKNKLRFKVNLLSGITILMLIINFSLAIALINLRQLVVLLPTIDKELRIGSNYVSDEYLKLRAEQILNLLFSMRHGNVDFIYKQLLKQVDASSLDVFTEQLEKFAQDIESRKYFYVFNNIQKIEIDSFNLLVNINGYLEIYMADKRISSSLKQYKLSFLNRNGLVKLASFEEVKNEDN